MLTTGKKTILVVLAEFLLILLGVAFWMIIGIIGKRPFAENGVWETKDTEILSMSGIEETDDGYYYTNNGDPWFIINYDGRRVLNIELSFTDGMEQRGKVYYAGEDMGFSEENSEEFRFKSDQNVIFMDDNTVKTLRVDITDKEGCKFKVISICEENAFLFQIKHLNYIAMILISIGLTILCEGIKRVQGDSTKIKYLFFAVLCVSLICVFGQFILGKGYYIYTDIGSDTFFQYYPYYVNTAISIKNGTFSVWSWDYGLGTSVLNTAAWVMDPFGIGIVVCGIIFGLGSIHHALVWMQILKIVFAYLICKKYIKMFCKNEFAVCLGAYLYAFNGYLLLWGQHYFLGTNCIFILFMLIAIERFIRCKGKTGGLQIAFITTWILMYSYYAGYIILITAAVYFVYRYLTVYKDISLKQTIITWLKCIYSVVAGVFLSGIVFIPSCYYIMTNSSRLDGTTSGLIGRIIRVFGGSFTLRDMGSRLSRLMSNNLLYINDGAGSRGYFLNYYEMPQLFCTIFIFFFAGQWIIYEIKEAKKQRSWIALSMKLFLLYLLFFNGVSGLVLNAFAYESYRYTFVIFPIVSLGIAILWERVICDHKIETWGIVIGGGLSACAWGYSYGNMNTEVSGYVMGTAFLLLVGFVIILLMRKNIKYPQMVCLFAFLIVLTTILDGYVTTNQRGYIKKEDYPLVWEKSRLVNDTASAINWLKEYDDSFYRIEKTYGDWDILADSFFEQYSTPTWYNSTPNVNISDFYNNIYNMSGTQAVKYCRFDSDLALRANSLLNIKYIFSQSELNDYWCELISKKGNVYIYKNMQTDSVAKWYGKTVLKEDFCELDDESKTNILKDAVVVEQNIDLDETATAIVDKFSLKKQTELTGTVTCTGKGILMLAIPDQEGWKVYVDGIETEQFNVDYGFIGVKLEAGTHMVSVKYSIPQKNTGLIVSVIGIMMFAVILISEKRTNLLD